MISTNDNQTRNTGGHVLYTIPLRLVDNILCVNIDDIPEPYRTDFCEMLFRGKRDCVPAGTLVRQTDFAKFCESYID